jgi:glycosyltransferase involved in cell wall biosynthesis
VPLVSVLIAAREDARGRYFVREACRSVLEQSYPRVECLVVDDASDPPLAEVLGGEEPSVRVFRQETSLERARVRNAALELAAGEWVFFLDHDDLLERSALERLLGAATATRSDVIFGYTESIEETVRPPFVVPKVSAEPAARTMRWTERLRRPDRFGIGVLYRRSAIRDTRFRDDFVGVDDLVFSLEVARRSRCALLPEVVYGYRMHREQSTTVEGHRRRLDQGERAMSYLLENESLSRRERAILLAAHQLYGHAYFAWREQRGGLLLASCGRALRHDPLIALDPMWWRAAGTGLRLGALGRSRRGPSAVLDDT